MPGVCQRVGDCLFYCGEVLEMMAQLADASVHLIVADPPYFRVKAETWDRQWPSHEKYLDWLGVLAKEWRRILTPNGSLYCFASPHMAARVEVMLSDTFHILNHITWRKHDGSGAGTGGHSKVSAADLMRFFPQSERLIFAEQYTSEAYALGESGYQHEERSLRISLFSGPILEAMHGTHTTAKEVTEGIGAYGNINHGGAVSNWLQGYNIPTKSQYEAMRIFFNSRNGRIDYLRREYEDLRRPFSVIKAGPYTDVWDFATVQASSGKHPCEKPIPLLRHIITTSSRPGDTILDPMAGSGSTAEAAKQCGRHCISIEQDRRWYDLSISRVQQELLFAEVP